MILWSKSQRRQYIEIGYVFFKLCNVVRDIVYDVHIQIIRSRVKRLGKCLDTKVVSKSKKCLIHRSLATTSISIDVNHVGGLFLG